MSWGNPTRRSSGSPSRLSELLVEAREGSAKALGEALDGCRQYLLLIAHQELDDSIRTKAAVSDVVQETFVEALRDFERFDGKSSGEFRAWLRQILLNNIANTWRKYGQSQMRNVHREVPLDDSAFTALAATLADTTSSPSRVAVYNEERQQLEAALDTLSDDDQLVLRLRHQKQLTFREIGERMNRSADAARMLWWRAFERLASCLEGHDVRES